MDTAHAQQTQVLQNKMIFHPVGPGHRARIKAGENVIGDPGDKHGHESQEIEMNVHKPPARPQGGINANSNAQRDAKQEIYQGGFDK